jgi:hypothetical protein
MKPFIFPMFLFLLSYHEAKESIVYSYTKSFNAFAAKLSEDEANKLSGVYHFSLASNLFKNNRYCFFLQIFFCMCSHG